MSRHWKEPLDLNRHRDHFGRGFRREARKTPKDSLIPAFTYCVRAADFTFEFASVPQIAQALEFVRQKARPSSIVRGIWHEHEWQRWHERLPRGLTREPHRIEIMHALEAALREFDPSGTAAVSPDRLYDVQSVYECLSRHSVKIWQCGGKWTTVCALPGGPTIAFPPPPLTESHLHEFVTSLGLDWPAFESMLRKM